MIILFLGLPASGKGTQSELVAQNFKIPHVSTGDMFREAIRQKTPAGVEAARYIDDGKFVPDETTIKIVRDRINQSDCNNGFILDGFPRNIPQAKALDQLLKDLNWSISSVINLQIDQKELYERISGRRVCKTCGSVYHILKDKPKVENRCDNCGATLTQRKDDNLESLKVRLDYYNQETKPLVDYYRSLKVLTDINGQRDKQIVFQDVAKVLTRAK